MIAKDQIEQVLFDDPLRLWSCSELAQFLHLTGRTISQEVRQLREADKVERVYGKRRRLTFKAKLSIEYPRWLEPKHDDIQRIMVIGIHRHVTEEE